MPISKIKSSAIDPNAITGSAIADGTVTSADLDTNIAISGDLTVDTNTLYVDSTNNRVGIGTVTPTRNLVISDSSQANIALQTSASGSTLNDGFQIQADSSNAYVWNYENTNILFGTNNTTRMTVDANGYVTKPNTPSFCIFGDTNPNFVSDGSDTTIFIGHSGSGASAFDHNIGGHWSYTTGRFTAPAAGRYYFSFTVTTNDTNSHFVDIHKNGARVGGHALSYGVGYITATKTVILDLAANDYVDARRRGSGYSFYSGNFAGYLLG